MIDAAIRHWRLAGFLFLAAALLWALGALSAERLAHANLKAAHADANQKAVAIELAASERNRKLEQELNDALQDHTRVQMELAKSRERDAIVARANGLRLRDAANGYATAVSGECADADTPSNQQAATEAAKLLAELLARVADRTTELAAFADDSYAAAAACAANYKELENAINQE